MLRKASCRGIVTADVLEQGLSRRAIALGSLKGLNGTKETREFYTSSAPYDEGKSLRLVGISIAGFRSSRGSTRRLGYRLVVSYPKPPPGRPLIYMG